MFYGVSFYVNCLNLFNISSLFSGRIIISPASLELSEDNVLLLLLLLQVHLLLQLPAKLFLEAVFRASTPALAAVSNNFFAYLFERFLRNDINPYPLTYFLFLVL